MDLSASDEHRVLQAGPDDESLNAPPVSEPTDRVYSWSTHGASASLTPGTKQDQMSTEPLDCDTALDKRGGRPEPKTTAVTPRLIVNSSV